MDDLLREFLAETSESLDVVGRELVRFEQDPNNADILSHIFRLVHTIKGTCGFIGLPRLEALAHAAENLMDTFRDGMPVTADAVSLILATIDQIKVILTGLETTGAEPDGHDHHLINQLHEAASPPQPCGIPQAATQETAAQETTTDELERAFRETPADPPPPIKHPSDKHSPDSVAAPDNSLASQTLRVNVDTLEHLMTMVSELVLTRNQLLEISRRHQDSEFKVPLQRLSNVTAELQEGVMKTRMQPVGNAWQKLPRIVRDLSTELGKQIELRMHGAATELDRQVLDLIKDPLTHMVRNSADHGLETPAERIAAGKPPQGTIRLTAHHEGGHIIIRLHDDGRGLDTARIRAKALANGVATEAELETMTEAQIHRFVFASGFSTAAAVTSISGRGVGMDVVRSNIDRIGGTIDIASTAGKGTSVTVKIPLTLAIVSALIVECSGDRYAIPQSAVVELVRVRHDSAQRIELIKDAPVLRLRDQLLPLIYLDQLLRTADGPPDPDQDNFVVVMQLGEASFGVVVSGVFHTEEIVIKPMSSRLRHVSLFSGNTILGDGAVIMILDPNGLAQVLDTPAASRPDISVEAATAPANIRTKTSLLIFRAGSQQPKAVPLALVTRLEEFPADRIERSGGRDMVQYRQHLMPLVRMEGVAPRDHGLQPTLVFAESNRAIGLLVDEIVDIVEDHLHIELADARPGTLGSAVIKAQATEVIDIGHFLPMAFPDGFNDKADEADTPARSVLLVDDSAFFRNMLAPMLKAAGYHVHLAGSASEGLDALRSGDPIDLILTDIDMPGMDGFSFAEAIHADSDIDAPPIIGLSAHSSAAAIARGQQAGFQSHVAKFDRAGLIATLRQHIPASRRSA